MDDHIKRPLAGKDRLRQALQEANALAIDRRDHEAIRKLEHLRILPRRSRADNAK